MKAQQSNAPVSVIFDTDMGPDYDDVGAIAMLHAFDDRGEATILATIASTKYEGVAAVLNVLNTYFGKPEIPIGVPTGNALEMKDSQHWTDSLIAKYPHHIRDNREATEAVALYRQILSQQPDNSVTIITVGFLTNLESLLKSPPDDFSPLPGKELVNQKVKSLVSMAGKFPSGKEFNIAEDAKAAKYVFEKWNTPILLSGHEIGNAIKSGLPLIYNKSIQNNPVKDAYLISIPKAQEDSEGRMSWDQTAVLVAIKGPDHFFKLRSGSMQVKEDGTNSWIDKGENHQYLIEDKPVAEVQKLINDLMMHQPRKRNNKP
jgi:inosine-uridine nucleoside N-ribohydrolase